jgi:hypothetical protein
MVAAQKDSDEEEKCEETHSRYIPKSMVDNSTQLGTGFGKS